MRARGRRVTTNMTRATLVAAAIFLLAPSTQAAEIKCLRPAATIVASPPEEEDLPYLLGPFTWSENGPEQCSIASLSGEIVDGDASKLEWLLTDGGGIDTLVLSSPGGNAIEAMMMGRMLRVKWVHVRTACGVKGDCCASACSLLYYGGASWQAGDRLGLHRASRIDAANVDYYSAKVSSLQIDALISAYAVEMEMPKADIETMMRAAPNEVGVAIIKTNNPDATRAFPRSIHDWLLAKCANSAPDAVAICMSSEKPSYNDDDDEAVKQFTWYAHLTTRQLQEVLEQDPDKPGFLRHRLDRPGAVRVGALRRVAAEHELELRITKR